MKKNNLLIKNLFLVLISLLLVQCASDKNGGGYTYSSPEVPWEESFGNHRAVIQVAKPSNAVKLDLLWRRHDLNPESRRFMIVNALTGDTVKNIYRLSVEKERCHLVFGPIDEPGDYYFYYLPYEVQKDYGFYNKGYLERENDPDAQWVADNRLVDSMALRGLPVASVSEIQARTAFDSFYPMEVIPTSHEKAQFLQAHQQDFFLFPEDRKYPIRMQNEIPHRWIGRGLKSDFEGKSLRNEYYTFQIGVWAPLKTLENICVAFTDLRGPGNSVIASDMLTCFNTGGIDPYGKAFKKEICLDKGNVQALWIGVDISQAAKPGSYEGEVLISADGVGTKSLVVKLDVEDELIADRGDSETWRHSRLRWLNSTAGLSNEPVAPYHAIERTEADGYAVLGRTIQYEPNGLPGKIMAGATSIINRPIEFTIETKSGKETFSFSPENENIDQGLLVGSRTWTGNNLYVNLTHSLEFDGYLLYRVRLEATKDVDLKDVRLEIPFSEEVGQYMKVMGDAGREVPASFDIKWDGPFDSFWLGNQQGGIWCELRGSDYHGPMLNLYHTAHPSSWNNNQLGGIRVRKGAEEVLASAYSGQRSLKAGESLDYEFAFLVTPVKPVDYHSQFVNRYYHRGDKPRPIDKDFEAGVKIINVHHANDYNPHINYPFVAVDSMRVFVDEMHSKGQKVKIYYTIRELTNYATEIWALRSLGNEILGAGEGGGYPWLREHFVTGYRPQWYQHFSDKSADASIVNAPGDSRWYNYYIEGLRWLVKHVDIDGLYLDDVSYDRRILKRMRRVMEEVKPGCIIDLHSNTGFSKGPVTQYAEFFPYMDKLWFGESFHYDRMSPANWLVEVSGIPFGLMGDMLHAGGNRWLGMLYGMTVRHPWLTEGVTCDPRPVWKVWDDFGIEYSRMVGFWEENPVVLTNSEKVKATTYVKDGKALIAVGNFSDQERTCQLRIDWKALGLTPDKASLYAPAIKDYQPSAVWNASDVITVKARQGWLIVVEER